MVEEGETVVIARHGKPVAEIIRAVLAKIRWYPRVMTGGNPCPARKPMTG